MVSDLILAVQARVPSSSAPAPLSEAALGEAEVRLGFALPPLLRELYQHVGNGRFGPGHGLLSLDDLGDGELSAVNLYLGMHQEDPAQPLWKWPTGLLAFCDWGCNIYSCVDCINPPNAVLTYEYVQGPMVSSFAPTRNSLESWLRDWLAGIPVFESVYEDAPELDRVTINPFSKGPMVIKGRKPRRH